MFKIGDFSKFSRVSIRALRLYDQMGLLKPIHVDQLTGYRYYSAAQISRLNRIVAFKDLGFSLEQIIQLLNDKISSDQMRGMLRLKQAEVQQLIEIEQVRLSLIEVRLRQIEQEDSASTSGYDVILKHVEAQTVAAIRDVMPMCTDIKHLYDKLEQELQCQKAEMVGFPQALWHDEEYRLNNVDVEVVIPINRLLSEKGRVKSYRLPEVKQMACVIYHGSHDGLIQAFNALLKWIEENNFQIIGSDREIYWQPRLLDANFIEVKDDLTIEVQFPVCSAKMDLEEAIY
jgi:DNA-binding transcriptional MerR regulator